MAWVTAYAYHLSVPLTVDIPGAPPGTATLGTDGRISGIGFSPGSEDSYVRVRRADGGVMPKCRMTLVSVAVGGDGPNWYFDRTGATQSVSPAEGVVIEKTPQGAVDEISASVQVGS